MALVRLHRPQITDHNPVEAHFRHGKIWHKHAHTTCAPSKPAVHKMTGNTESAVALRQVWMHEVEPRLQATSRPDWMPTQRWDNLYEICRDVAIQVCGILDKTPGAPWLTDRKTDLQRLDQEIATAREQDRLAQRTPQGDRRSTLQPQTTRAMATSRSSETKISAPSSMGRRLDEPKSRSS